LLVVTITQAISENSVVFLVRIPCWAKISESEHRNLSSHCDPVTAFGTMCEM